MSVDIDVLILRKDLPKAMARLGRKGFHVSVIEPYTVTMIRKGVIVDLYTYPSFGWTVYIDGEELLRNHAEEIKVDGLLVNAISKEAEVVVTASHAAYKEHIYLLADHYVLRKWGSRRSIQLAEELGVLNSLKLCLGLSKLAEEGLVELPYKIPPGIALKTMTDKLIHDPVFRASSLNIAKYIMSRRGGRAIYSRLTRRTY